MWLRQRARVHAPAAAHRIGSRGVSGATCAGATALAKSNAQRAPTATHAATQYRTHARSSAVKACFAIRQVLITSRPRPWPKSNAHRTRHRSRHSLFAHTSQPFAPCLRHLLRTIYSSCPILHRWTARALRACIALCSIQRQRLQSTSLIDARGAAAGVGLAAIERRIEIECWWVPLAGDVLSRKVRRRVVPIALIGGAPSGVAMP